MFFQVEVGNAATYIGCLSYVYDQTVMIVALCVVSAVCLLIFAAGVVILGCRKKPPMRQPVSGRHPYEIPLDEREERRLKNPTPREERERLGPQDERMGRYDERSRNRGLDSRTEV